MRKKLFNIWLKDKLIEQINNISDLTYRKRPDLIRMWIEQGVQRTYHELEQIKKEDQEIVGRYK